MKNMQIAGTGNSRWMKSAISETATWEEVRGLLRSGTFPFDLNGLNEAGILERGTPYNVESVLKDATAAKYGLGAAAVPNDMWNALGGLPIPAAKGGTGVTSLAALATAIGSIKIQTVSYAGTNMAGESNKNTVTFSFVPKIIAFNQSNRNNSSWFFSNPVFCLLNYSELVYGAQNTSKKVASRDSGIDIIVSFSNNYKTISWYNDDNNASKQMNSANTYYTVTAFG